MKIWFWTAHQGRYTSVTYMKIRVHVQSYMIHCRSSKYSSILSSNMVEIERLGVFRLIAGVLNFGGLTTRNNISTMKPRILRPQVLMKC